MAVLHDYGCEVEGCEEIAFDQMSDSPPKCPRHPEAQMEVRYFPKHYRPFAEFDYEGEDGKTVRITSLHQIRQIEERSMEAWRRGEGRPELFRRWNQDNSNRDKNLLQHLHPQVPREKLRLRNRRGMPIFGGARPTVVEDVEFGED